MEDEEKPRTNLSISKKALKGAKDRQKALGYSSFSAYVEYLINYDVKHKPSHTRGELGPEPVSQESYQKSESEPSLRERILEAFEDGLFDEMFDRYEVLRGRKRDELESEHKKRLEENRKNNPDGYQSLVLMGEVAAGSTVSFLDEEVKEYEAVDRYYPMSDHYALRVVGKSMEPKLEDESIIVVQDISSKGLIPKKGSMVVYVDSTGASVKEFTTKYDEDKNRIGVLKSLNPDYPDLVPDLDGKIIGIVVSVFKPIPDAESLQKLEVKRKD